MHWGKDSQPSCPSQYLSNGVDLCNGDIHTDFEHLLPVNLHKMLFFFLCSTFNCSLNFIWRIGMYIAFVYNWILKRRIVGTCCLYFSIIKFQCIFSLKSFVFCNTVASFVEIQE